MSSPNLEGLELREATPSIAPSNYTSVQYTRKWRILFAIGLGVSIIGICILTFYLSVKSRKPLLDRKWTANNSSREEIVVEPSWQWRTLHNDQCFVISELSTHCPEDFGDIVTLLIAFGGLRPNQIKDVPALSEFVRCGVSATHLVPTYPTLTYTNLYTIATGLYAESHGIVGDEIYDPIFDMNFTIDTPSAHKSEWWGGEPLWNTVKKVGKQSATYLWPGSDVRIQNRYPSYWQRDEKPFGERIDKVLDWIRLPKKERPELIMMYYDGPSQSAQHNGIFSDSVDEVLRDIGIGLDELISGLEREDAMRCVNMVVVSDHGIAPSHCDESILLDDILVGTNTAKVFLGPVGRLMFPNKEEEKQVMEKLECKEKKVRVLSKNRVPKRYHYTNNERIGGMVLDAKVGSRIALEHQNPCLEGDYGYNNLEPSMQGVFIAHGPSFKNGFTIESFRNIEIYNLICQLMGVEPAPNNGTTNSLTDIFKEGALNITSVNVTEEAFVEEVFKSRPLRKQNAVLGVRGIDNESIEHNCSCDSSVIVDEGTKPNSKSTTLITSKPPLTSQQSSLQQSTIPTTSKQRPITSTTSHHKSITSTTSEQKPTTTTTLEVETILQHVSEKNSVPPITNKSPQFSATLSTVLVGSTMVEESKTSSIIHPTTQSSIVDNLSDRSKRSPQKRAKNNIKKGLVDARNDSVKFTKNLLELHAPWGIPAYTAPEVKSDYLNVLPQTNYIIGFLESLNIPVWTSFTLTRSKLEKIQTYTPTVPKGVEVDEKNLKREVPLGCWMADSRLTRSSQDQCSRSLQIDLYNAQNISLRQLFPEELELPENLSKEGFLLSNLSPMRQGYENGGRNAILRVLNRWTLNYGAINVIHGPVFDYNFDGKRDLTTQIRDSIKPIIASDFFYVISLCDNKREPIEGETMVDEINSLKLCEANDLKSFCFILPNTDIKDDCLMTEEEYLLYHLSSLWDVQTLTGLKFYKNMPTDDYIKRIIHQPISIPFNSKENKV